MELTWQLKGYATNISVLRRREALNKALPREKQIVESGRLHRRSEKAHEDLLCASGSRYVGPIR